MMGHHRLCDEPNCQGGCWDLREDEPSPPSASEVLPTAGYDDPNFVAYLHRELNDLFGWRNESLLHAIVHVRNAVLNLRCDLSTEKALVQAAENDAKCARKRGVAAERNRIIALLTERAEATREPDGRETAVSLTYRKAIEAIQAEEI
jgi:hypothetical protein